MIRIKNRSAYPKSLKRAALEAWKTTERSGANIADDFNISSQTLSRWEGDEKLQRGTMHPAARAGLKRYRSGLLAEKAKKTPQLNADGTITFNGKTYRA